MATTGWLAGLGGGTACVRARRRCVRSRWTTRRSRAKRPAGRRTARTRSAGSSDVAAKSDRARPSVAYRTAHRVLPSETPKGRRAETSYSGISHSGNQRAMSSSIGSSRPAGPSCRSSCSVSRCLVARRRHERVVGAALEVVDEVDALAVVVEGEDGGQQAVAVAAALELGRERVHRHDEVVEVGVAQDRSSGSRTRRRRTRASMPVSWAVPRRSSSASLRICSKSAVAIGWNTIAGRAGAVHAQRRSPWSRTRWSWRTGGRARRP